MQLGTDDIYRITHDHETGFDVIQWREYRDSYLLQLSVTFNVGLLVAESLLPNGLNRSDVLIDLARFATSVSGRIHVSGIIKEIHYADQIGLEIEKMNFVSYRRMKIAIKLYKDAEPKAPREAIIDHIISQAVSQL